MDKVICKAGQFEIKKMKVSKMGSQSEKNPGECIKNHVQFIKILVKTRPQKTVKRTYQGVVALSQGEVRCCAAQGRGSGA